MIITIQVQLDPLDNRTFTENEIDVFEGEMYTLCSNLEKYSYLKAQLFVDGKVRNT